jgi:cytoplasmic FMR1 interacting protein
MQGGMFSEKNITKDLVPEFERFYDRLFFFTYLLDFKGTLSSCLDMSDLWYREFYLEITKVNYLASCLLSKDDSFVQCVQFPISMSLPFILAEHVVNTPHIADSLLFCIDIYNDASSRALNDLKQQFIFREVEAELNLAFNTLVGTPIM